MTAAVRPATTAADRGVKRRCGDCDAPFYDMLRFPILCPKCGAELDTKSGKKKLASVPRSHTRTRGGKAAVPAPIPEADDAPAGAKDESEPDEESESEESETEDSADGEADDAGEDDGDDNVTGDH